MENKNEISNSNIKLAYLFCYILPCIIFGFMVAPTIIGLIIFVFMLFRGKDEFKKGKQRCEAGIISVDWEFTKFDYSVSGNISAGIKDLDFFLVLIGPLIRLLIGTMWKIIDGLSIFVLKFLFFIGTLIYRLILKESTEFDKPSIVFAILSFFIPFLGFVLFFILRKEQPRKAKSCIKGTIIQIIILLSITISMNLYYRYYYY